MSKLSVEKTPVGDHQANGHIESAVRQLKSQMRALRLGLEARLGKVLAEDDPILCWVATFAGDVIARFRKGSDGKTPWQRETGRRWAGEPLEFGERVFIKEAKERGGVAKKDWEPRLLEARFVGQHARTGAILGLTSQGVIFGRLGRRVPEEERWILEGWDVLKGVPWDMNPTGRAQPRVVVESQPGGGERIPMVRISEAAPRLFRGDGQEELEAASQRGKYEPLHQEFYIMRGDIERFGASQGCKACEHIKSGRPGKSKQAHSEACRERITAKLVEENSTRVEAYMMRYAEKDKRRPKRRISEEEGEEEEGISPGSPKISKEAPPKPAEKRGAEMSSEELRDAVGESQERAAHEEERERLEEKSSSAHIERQGRLERDAGRPAREIRERGEVLTQEGLIAGSPASTQGGGAGSSAPNETVESIAGGSASIGELPRLPSTAGGSASIGELPRLPSTAGGSASTGGLLRLPAEVAQEDRKDMEDVVAAVVHSLDVDSQMTTIGDSNLGFQKEELAELVMMQVDHYRHQVGGEELEEPDLAEISALLVELCGAQVIELFLSRDAACNLERCIDSMWMLTTALFGSRLQGHECKRKTAEWSIEHLPPCLACSIVLDLHCAQSILAYRQHRL